MNKQPYTTTQVEALCDMYKVMPLACIERHPGMVTVAEQLKHGLIFIDPDCTAVPVDRNMYLTAKSLYGVDGDQMNATFYKNFKTVTEMSRFELFVDQVIHYLGTYGAEAMGLKPITLIPVQEFDVPDVDLSKIKVTVIRLVRNHTITGLVNESLMTIKSPSKRIVTHMESLIPLAEIALDNIKSFELMVMACDYAGVVPENGKLWLRYAIYKLTGDTLIIKNQKMVNAIKRAADDKGDLCKRLLERGNPVYLSRIFLRYKPLFLAMKSHRGCAPLINKLRRMADTYHEPLSDVTVQNYVRFAMTGNRSALATLRKQMDTRDMVKVLNSMLVRLNANAGDPSVYNIRNGRAFCKEDGYKALTRAQKKSLELEIDNLYDAIVAKVTPLAKGKTYYIPAQVRYAVPQSEKQYIGNLPWGTVIVPDEGNPETPMSVGIHWNNTETHRVDLDLHGFSKTTHFGWNGAYSKDGATVIYSGDMTNAPAPDGAAEAYWIDGQMEPVIFTVNEYHGPTEMHFQLFFASERIDKNGELPYRDRYDHPYTMDPNALIIPPVPMYINGDRTYTIGFFHQGEFYCYSGNLSEGIVPTANYSQYLDAVILQQKCHMSMAGLLERAGAIILNSREDADKAIDEGVAVIDLSPEALTATTLLDIVDGKE